MPLVEVDPAPLLELDRDGIVVDLPSLGPTRVGLRGRHQAANVAVADAVLDALAAAGIARVDAAARRSGYAAARWPGRLELLEVDGREILLDGAHNPAGASALATALGDLRPFLADGPLTLVTATMADKDVDGVVAAIARAPALAGATVIATTLDLPRAMPADELAARWAAVRLGEAQPRVAPNPMAALELRPRRSGRPHRRRGLALSCRGDPGRPRGRPGPARPRRARPLAPGEDTMTLPTAHDRHPAPTRIGRTLFTWGARTYVMGIVNVTPDSFSGDGLLAGRSSVPGASDAIELAVATATTMVADGADILDIGGESTRPGHVEVTAEIERDRVVPVIAAVRRALPETPDQRRHDQAERRRGGPGRGRRRAQRRLGRRA